ncbi:MAG: helix-turn-helix transcriptional regulator [Polyangiaceae bacterium]
MRNQAALELLEAAYDLRLDSPTWLSALAHAARAVDKDDLGVLVGLYELGEAVHPIAYARTNDAGAAFEAMDRVALVISPEVHRVLTCETSTEAAVTHRIETQAAAAWTSTLGHTEVRDSFNFQGADGAHALCVMVALREPTSPPPRTRATFLRVAVHLATALRLRSTIGEKRPIDDAAAIVSADGQRLLHKKAELDEEASHGLFALVKDSIEARRTSSGDSERLLSLWTGLLAGRWSLVDSFDTDGRRYWVAHENEPVVAEDRRLTRRERQVVTMLAAGHSDTMMAYALGLSLSTVRTHLERARKKLGPRGLENLTRLARFLPDQR